MNTLIKFLAVVLIWSMCGISIEAGQSAESTTMELFPFTDIPRDFTEEIITERLDVVEGVIDLEYSSSSRELLMRYMLGGRKETKRHANTINGHGYE